MAPVWSPDGQANPPWPVECDLRYQYGHDAWDPEAKTLFGKPAEFEDFDVSSAIEDLGVRKVFIQMMRNVESCEDKVDGFKQVGRQVLVCGRGESHTAILSVCWECKWLSKAHRPDCAWQAVKDVAGL